jgi:hypothetical protein
VVFSNRTSVPKARFSRAILAGSEGQPIPEAESLGSMLTTPAPDLERTNWKPERPPPISTTEMPRSTGAAKNAHGYS